MIDAAAASTAASAIRTAGPPPSDERYSRSVRVPVDFWNRRRAPAVTWTLVPRARGRSRTPTDLGRELRTPTDLGRELRTPTDFGANGADPGHPPTSAGESRWANRGESRTPTDLGRKSRTPTDFANRGTLFRAPLAGHPPTSPLPERRRRSAAHPGRWTVAKANLPSRSVRMAGGVLRLAAAPQGQGGARRPGPGGRLRASRLGTAGCRLVDVIVVPCVITSRPVQYAPPHARAAASPIRRVHARLP